MGCFFYALLDVKFKFDKVGKHKWSKRKEKNVSILNAWIILKARGKKKSEKGAILTK